MKIYLGADHRGFELKNHIKTILTSQNISYEDLGNTEYDPHDDYPIFAERVAKKVAEEKEVLGIVFCGSGAGVDITANKIDGVRSVLAISPEQVEAARRDDKVNVLAIASDYTDTEQVEKIITAFANTPYEATAKRERRLEQIETIEYDN